MPKLSRLVPVAVAALVTTALLAPSPATSQVLPALPELSAEELLAMANVAAPPAGIGLEIHADFPVENPLTVGGVEYTSLTASILPTGGVETHSATPARGGSSAPANECADNFFAPTGRRWFARNLPVVWKFRRGSRPAYLGKYRTQQALRTAHQAWGKSFTDCKETDQITFSFDFGGVTTKKLGYNGHNTIEFGDLGQGALAINYTWYTSDNEILETDLRFNRNDYTWTNVAKENKRYHVVNVAAHELGHQIGLDDLSDPHGRLTMFGRIGAGELSKLTLGAGDVRGATVLSP